MPRPLKLRNVLTVATTVLTCGLILLVILTVGEAGVRRVEDQIGGSVVLLADQMQDKLDRALFERYREIAAAARMYSHFTVADNREPIAAWISELQTNYPDYVWIGFADRSGKVECATGGMLEGMDVSAQAWFQAGLKEATVGDLHEDKALADSISQRSGSSPRFLAISAPVVDASGATIGVVAAMLDWTWVDEVRDSLFDTAPKDRTEQVFVLNDAGVVLLGPPDLTGKHLQLASLQSAKTGMSRYGIEKWPDGEHYVTGYARSDGYRNFAGLGWIVLVRQRADTTLAPVRRLQNQVLFWGLGLAGLGALAAWMLSGRIAAPLLRLANSADAIRRGDEVRIPDVRDYAEVETLSQSLETLVSELKHRQAALEELNVSLEAQVSERTAELLARNTALTRAREEAEDATTAKSRFLAAASHDLRQPLHAMMLFVRALSRRVSGDEAPRLVEQLEISLVSLKEMFDSLLNVTRLDAGLIQPDFASVHVAELLQRISEAFRAEAEARGLSFKCRGIDAVIVTDPVLLETILRNLVANALKFTRQGGVLLAAHKRSGRVAFEVWDTGSGISDEMLERVFDEFERSREHATGPNDGLGLGLSMVQRYARLLGIDVELTSRLGRGTAFTLLMPDATAEAVIAPPPPQPVEETELPPGLNVLLLDDDPQILAAMSRELSDRGCNPRSFSTSGDAEAALSAGLDTDVAIVDFNLGGSRTGPELLEHLERDRGTRIPALILTGGTDIETLATVMATGRPWLIKPADPEAVARALGELVRKPNA